MAESKGEEEDSDGGSEGGEEERTKPRAKAAGKGSQSAATADPKVKKLQAVCRAAGIKIPPSIYVKVCCAQAKADCMHIHGCLRPLLTCARGLCPQTMLGRGPCAMAAGICHALTTE